MDEGEIQRMREDDDRRWILVEKMAGDMESIKENVSQIPGIADRLSRVEVKVDRIEGELVVHSHILREHSQTLKEHTEMLMELQTDMTELKATSHVHA